MQWEVVEMVVNIFRPFDVLNESQCIVNQKLVIAIFNKSATGAIQYTYDITLPDARVM